MEERFKASARLQVVLDQKKLLHLHAAMHVDSFWQAVQDVIVAAFPTCFIGLTLQHSPISPRITKSTKKLPGSFFPMMPIKNYFSAHPRRNIVLISDFFRDERHFRRSSFYRSCMRPINGRCAIGLFFWDIRRLLASIILVRNQQQGEPSPHEMRVIRNLHAHLKTALRRIRSEERDRIVRMDIWTIHAPCPATNSSVAMEFEIGLSKSSRKGVLWSMATRAVPGAPNKIEGSGSS